MNQTITSGRISEFAVGIGAPILAIAAYAASLGVSVGDNSTIVAAVVTGALMPLVDRFVFKPGMQKLGLESDQLLQFSARATLNAALGLMFAVWIIVPPAL